MGKQHRFYRVKLGGRKQHCIKKLKKSFTSSNIIEAQKPKYIHGHFYVNGLIFLHSNTGKIKILPVKPLTSKGTIIFIRSLEEIKIITQEVSR